MAATDQLQFFGGRKNSKKLYKYTAEHVDDNMTYLWSPSVLGLNVTDE